jgi:beta-lactamase regulating signal transducer with metallopeptidase domain
MGIVNFSLSVSLFVLVVVMLRVTVGFRLPKMTFRALWATVLVVLLIPINIPSHFSVFNLFEQQNADIVLVANEPVAPTAPAESVVEGGAVIIIPPSEIPAIATPERPPPTVPDYTESTAVTNATSGFSLFDYLHYILVAGSVIIFTIAFISHFRQRRQYAVSLPCDEEFVSRWQNSHKLKRRYSVRTLETITSPLTYGLLKPVILLPSTLDFSDENKVNCILYHEFIHIKRLDILWKFISLVVLAVHWFNPLIWVAYVLMNRDIELSCDEEVVKRIGDQL